MLIYSHILNKMVLYVKETDHDFLKFVQIIINVNILTELMFKFAKILMNIIKNITDVGLPEF